MNAAELSDFEFCGRYPALNRVYEPEALPVRIAVKRAIEKGTRAIYAKTMTPQECAVEFLAEASSRGFICPKGDHYVIAQDHAGWIEAALELLPRMELEPLPPLRVEGEYVEIDGFHAGGNAHLFRVSSAFSESLKWAEMLLMGHYSSIVVHTLRLPYVTPIQKSISGGRLCSPAVMGYKHPMTGQIRLAKHTGEALSFGNSWKRIARWEIFDCSWEEWLEGMLRDDCINQVYQTHTVTGDYSDEYLRQIRRDVVQIRSSMERPHPRKRETCGNCMFLGLCHGGPDERSRYTGKNVLGLWRKQADHTLSQG